MPAFNGSLYMYVSVFFYMHASLCGALHMSQHDAIHDQKTSDTHPLEGQSCVHTEMHAFLRTVCLSVCVYVSVHLPSVRDDALRNGRCHEVIQQPHRAACSQARVRAHHEGKHKWLQQTARFRRGETECLKCPEHFGHTDAVCPCFLCTHMNVMRARMRDCICHSVCLSSLSLCSLDI
jgi:hypothetical protein